MKKKLLMIGLFAFLSTGSLFANDIHEEEEGPRSVTTSDPIPESWVSWGWWHLCKMGEMLMDIDTMGIIMDAKGPAQMFEIGSESDTEEGSN